MRYWNAFGWGALALFLALGAYGCGLGWGTDRDSLLVIASAKSILAGGYQRSRSFGFPLHEAACAMLFRLGGLTACNAGSLVVSAAGILLAARLAPAGRGWLAMATFSLWPMLLADASSAIDFGWDFTGGMALCLTARAVLRGGSVLGFGVAACALLLLRPDNVLFVAAVTVAVVWGAPGARRRVLGAASAAGCGAAAVYLGLNGAGMLAHAVTTTRPWPARVLRAGVFLSAALGPGGAAALAALCLKADAIVTMLGPEAAARVPGWSRKRGGLGREVPAPWGLERAEAVFLRRAAWLGWAFYLPRFVALPDQLDYLILPVALTVTALLAWAPARMAVPACVLLCLPSLVTISVLRRDARTGAVSVQMAPQWGTVAQDFSARRFAMRMEGQDMARRVTARTGLDGLRYDVFMPAYVSGEGDLVIGRMHLYRVVPMGGGLGALATVPRGQYRAIWACDGALGPGVGWRGWEAPAAAPRYAFRCAVIASDRAGQALNLP